MEERMLQDIIYLTPVLDVKGISRSIDFPV